MLSVGKKMSSAGKCTSLTEQASIITIFWMSTVPNVRHTHDQLHIHQYSKFCGFLVLLFLWSMNHGLISVLWDKVQAELTQRFSKRGKCYRIGMLIHRWKSTTNTKSVVGKFCWPRRKFYLHIYVAGSTRFPWPWQNYMSTGGH